MIRLPNMDLVQWDQTTDFFNYVELADTMQKIDDHDHSSATGGVQIPTDALQSNAVNASKIANGAVTSAKILDASVDTTKLTQNFLFNIIPTVTSLPVSAYDGQQVIFLADAANGITWNLRWREATFRWDVIGATTPLYATYLTSELTNQSASYVDLPTNAPTIATPIAGAYMFEFGATINQFCSNGLLTINLVLRHSNGWPNPPVDADSVQTFIGPGAASNHTTQSSVARRGFGMIIGNNSVTKMNYKRVGTVGSDTTGSFANRWISAMPQWCLGPDQL